MRYETSWHGDAVSTPVYDWFDQEDGIFEDFGDRSWDLVRSRADRTGANPAAVEERFKHLEPARVAPLGHRGPTQESAVAEPAETEQADLSTVPYGAARSL